MNRKHRIDLVAAVAAAVACGCASAATPQLTADARPEAASELATTRDAWAGCVRAAIPRLDEPQSTSEAVARAAMKGCSAQYSNMMQALVRTLTPSCANDPECTRGAKTKAEREATQTATDYVVTERVQVAGATVLKCL